jgi:hypothetical protein
MEDESYERAFLRGRLKESEHNLRAIQGAAAILKSKQKVAVE